MRPRICARNLAGGRATGPHHRLTLIRCLCASSQPDPSGFGSWRHRTQHHTGAFLRRTNGSPRHPRLQQGKAGCPASRIEPPALLANRTPSGRNRRDVQNGAASSAARYRVRAQSVDVGTPGQAVRSFWLADSPGQHRSHAPNLGAVRD